MNNEYIAIAVKCPWCRKGTTIADKPADVNISCRCSVCGQKYRVNFKTGRSIKLQSKKRIITKVSSTLPSPYRPRVAAYARVSSGKDAMLHSLAEQISYYNAYIQRRPEWEFAGVYADEAVTGTKGDRPVFQRMIADCRLGKINLIVTKSISRFARNTVDLLAAIRELKALSVDVFFERENIHSLSGDGELMLSILASYAQEESRSVSENCKWRIRKGFVDGKLMNWRFMYGYTINKGRIEINEEQAAVIHMIFDDYLSGSGSDKIAKKLNTSRVPSQTGGAWNRQAITQLIQNEKLTGNALLQKKFIADHLTKKEQRNRGELPKYYAEGTHPAIIDQETFDRAQAEIARRRQTCKSGQAPSASYPFTGKIFCENCGKRYRRTHNSGKVNWHCQTYMQRGKAACCAKQIPEKILKTISAEALGLPEFNENVFKENISEIRIPGANRLVFVFYNGTLIERTWHNRSRAESWTPEMKEQARQCQAEVEKQRRDNE